jgi:hypothetical protein
MPTIYFDVENEGNKTNIKFENSFIFHNPSFWDFEPVYYSHNIIDVDGIFFFLSILSCSQIGNCLEDG